MCIVLKLMWLWWPSACKSEGCECEGCDGVATAELGSCHGGGVCSNAAGSGSSTLSRSLSATSPAGSFCPVLPGGSQLLRTLQSLLSFHLFKTLLGTHVWFCWGTWTWTEWICGWMHQGATLLQPTGEGCWVWWQHSWGGWQPWHSAQTLPCFRFARMQGWMFWRRSHEHHQNSTLAMTKERCEQLDKNN